MRRSASLLVEEGPEQNPGADPIAVSIAVCFDEAASDPHKQALEVRPRTSAQSTQSTAAASKSDSKLIIEFLADGEKSECE